MITERLLEIADRTVKFALKHSIDQAQITAFLDNSSLTRFANSQIHQNVAAKRAGVAIKVISAKKIGTIQTNSLEQGQIEQAVTKAVKITKVSPPNKDFRSLPPPLDWTPIKGIYDAKTANCTPDFRAEHVKEAIETAHATSPLVKAVAGSFSADSIAFAVVNSLGISAWSEITLTSMQTTVISKSGSSQGFSSAEQHSRTISDINPAKIASEAAERSVKSINPKKIPTGEYEVVLSPRAIAGLLMYLGFIGFSATSYQDGQSFVKYNLNKQVFDKKLNVIDDPRDPHSLMAIAIDGEGVPKRKVNLITNGEVSETSICYDSFTAGKEGKESTGHSLPQIWGYYNRPLPFNLLADPGDSSIEEMIQETKHGIFITRFHYTNPVEPTKAILTGLTRDGTFLIENGKITSPVSNLRYTDSMLSALKEIPLISSELEIVEDVTTPAMKLEKLRFTGTTEY
jgi:PmbA protein